jgi:multidrug transporter EmrE-like cation transporter
LVVASPESATRGDYTTGVVLFDGLLDIVGVVGTTPIVAGVVLLTVVSDTHYV